MIVARVLRRRIAVYVFVVILLLSGFHGFLNSHGVIHEPSIYQGQVSSSAPLIADGGGGNVICGGGVGTHC